MKTTIRRLFGALCVLSIWINVGAGPVNGPVWSSAGQLTSVRPRQMKSIVPESNLRLTMTPVGIPKIWESATLAAVTDAASGGLQRRITATDPSQYIVFPENRFTWQNVVYSQSAPMWLGVLNPSAPFDQQRGGPLVALLICAQTLDGSDTLSLDSLVVSGSSSDGYNVLRMDDMYFTGTSYTQYAPAVTKTGLAVTSGSSAQLVSRLMVMVFPPLFNGGDTQEGLDQVSNWVNAQGSDWSLIYRVRQIGSSVQAETTVKIGNTPLLPRLQILRATGGTITLSVVGSDGLSYQILSGTNVNSITAVTGDTLTSTSNSRKVETNKPAEFFRIRVQ